MAYQRTDPVVRFYKFTSKQGECVIWTGYLNHGGYGQFALSRTEKVLAHRFAYEQIHGKIPANLTVDHLCKTPSCVNPQHMEIVTRAENTRRWLRTVEKPPCAAFNIAKTHCHKGHPYDSDNTYIRKGRRTCLRCNRERCRREYQIRKSVR